MEGQGPQNNDELHLGRTKLMPSENNKFCLLVQVRLKWSSMSDPGIQVQN